MRYYCTLFDKNYLIRFLALHDSLLRYAGDFKLWALCMDDATLRLLKRLKLLHVELIALKDFEDKSLRKIKDSRSWQEYCWTCTPSLPLYILEKYPDIDTVSYLDSDLFFYSSPEPIYKEMGKDPILIIPHRFANTPRWQKKKDEAGIYNVGMLTFRNNKEAKKCLRWWRSKCLDWCYYKVEKDRMGDQKYLDQFPNKFKGVHILRHLGAGVSHWNLRQYQLEKKDKGFTVDNYPLIFYHFQGFEVYSPNRFLSWGPPNMYTNWSVARKYLYEPYRDQLYSALSKIKNVAPEFNNGVATRPGLIKTIKESFVYWCINVRHLI